MQSLHEKSEFSYGMLLNLASELARAAFIGWAREMGGGARLVGGRAQTFRFISQYSLLVVLQIESLTKLHLTIECIVATGYTITPFF